jgi:hypothetical protein
VHGVPLNQQIRRRTIFFALLARLTPLTQLQRSATADLIISCLCENIWRGVKHWDLRGFIESGKAEVLLTRNVLIRLGDGVMKSGTLECAGCSDRRRREIYIEY